MKIKGTKEVLGVTGLSLGLGVIGSGIQNIDATTSSNMINAGQTASNFISPMVNISMGGFMIKQLKGLGK